MDIRGIRRRTWAEIDIDNAERNYMLVKNAVKAKICCVVKANAYGHSAVILGKLYEDLGADFLAVSNIEEALQLRNNGISLPILILGYTPEECAPILSENNISQCVYSEAYGKQLAESAFKAGVKLKIHIKIDTGMGRLGFKNDELDKALKVCSQKNIIPEGIFTHFAVADEGKNGREYTDSQFSLFSDAIDYLAERGVRFEIRHCANSAAVFDYPEYHLDMVRAGVVLYGLKPSEEVDNLPDLKPVMSLKSIISHIKSIHRGETLSYGRAFTANKETKVATVPIGYADGFSRAVFKAPYAIEINGMKAPIIGKVCMDQLMLDISQIDCSVGDVVTIFGAGEGITADNLAEAISTIGYEIICNVGERVPRAIVKNGEIICWRDVVYSMDLKE